MIPKFIIIITKRYTKGEIGGKSQEDDKIEVEKAELQVVEESHQQWSAQMETNIDMKITRTRYALRYRSKKRRNSQPDIFCSPITQTPTPSVIPSRAYATTPSPTVPSHMHTTPSPCKCSNKR